MPLEREQVVTVSASAENIGHANALRARVTTVIADAIRAQPRTLQTSIGPSQIGNPCARAILHTLNGGADPRKGEAAWRPAVGTAIHAQLELWFRRLPDRYLVEQRVEIGHHAGQDIGGTCDLYDLDTDTVIDWKSASAARLKAYRANGPSDIYRTQAHLYGLGVLRTLGHVPQHVAVAWLPRDGDLRDMHVWSEPWNPTIALDALNRLDQLYAELRLIGLDAALEQYPPCTDTWCGWCRDTTRPTTLAEAFAQASK